MTWLPRGNFWSLNPSPSWTSSGGVLSSTSRTNPGLLIGCSLSPRIERNFHGSQAAGREGVVEGLAPPGQGVLGPDHPVERRLARQVDGQIERGPGPFVHQLGARCVGAGDLQLAEPD